MDNKFRKIYTEQEIWELDLNELEASSGGAVETNEAKCPICKKYFPVREIKDHLRIAHRK